MNRLAVRGILPGTSEFRRLLRGEVKREDYVLQYYTVVGNQNVLLQENEDEEEENQVMYIVSQDGEDTNEDSSSNTFVEVNESLPFVCPTISNVLISVQDGQFYLTQNVSTDENLIPVQQETVSEQNTKEKDPLLQSGVRPNYTENIENEDCQGSEESNYQEIQLEDGTCAIIDSKLLNSIIEKSNIQDNKTSTETINKDEIDKKWVKKWLCQYPGCGRIYSTSHHLAVHNRTHTGSRPFKCIHCEKSFTTGYSLKAHLRIHTGEKPYPCKVCPKQFKTSGDLQKHNRIHTGEKPFRCPVKGCGKSFTTSNIRKVHIRSHTGERPYVCSTCGKAFASTTNYKNHIRIHSGEKPYVCNVEGCGKRFTEYSSLYKHNYVHQQTRPYPCSYCPVLFKQESSLKSHKIGEHGIIFGHDGNEIMMLSKAEKEPDFELSQTSPSFKSVSLLDNNEEDDPDDFYN